MNATLANNIISGHLTSVSCPENGLGWMLFNSCIKNARKTCHISSYDNKQYKTETFGSFKDRSSRVAKELLKRGAKPRDVVFNCISNHFDSALTTAAALYIGLIPTTIDPGLSNRECAHLLKLIEPKFIFVHEDSMQLIEDGLKKSGLETIGKLPQVIVHGTKTGKYINFEEFLKNEASDFHPMPVDNLDETCIILFSSGSTGYSKAICLSHNIIYDKADELMEFLGTTSCILHYSSLYWISAVMIFIGTFINGDCRLSAAIYEPEKTCKFIEKYKVTSSFMSSPTAYQIEAINTLKLKYDISSCTTILFAGGPVSAAQITRIRSWLPHCGVFLLYGMTETGGCLAGFTVEDRKKFINYPASCGRPSRGLQIKIVDPETEIALGPGKTGEFRYKCPHKMIGYYRQTEDNYDPDGFFKSGDLGYYDEHNLLYIVDRIRDIFKYMSWHIVPAEIEDIIKEHPAVLDCVVFGMPDEEAENLPAAAVVQKPNYAVTENEIQDLVVRLGVDCQYLRGGVYFIDALPKTPTGKMQRQKVKDLIINL